MKYPNQDREFSLPNTMSDLVNDWLALGVRPGGVLLVHASLRSLGPVEGGAETVVQSLLEAISPHGTLLMPALSYRWVGPEAPIFNVLTTPSCVGALPEYFRTRPGTIRSVHPTHSVSGVGPLVEDLLGEHIRSTTPCGPFSPFAKLPKLGGQILFLGCGLRPNTSMHAVEERIEPVYLYGDEVNYQVILANGSRQRMVVRSHKFEGWSQRYDRLARYLSSPDLREGKVLLASCYLVEASAMWPAALAALHEDPLCFVERRKA
jgi:aminoglycoside 3-N-acetyltransferase